MPYCSTDSAVLNISLRPGSALSMLYINCYGWGISIACFSCLLSTFIMLARPLEFKRFPFSYSFSLLPTFRFYRLEYWLLNPRISFPQPKRHYISCHGDGDSHDKILHSLRLSFEDIIVSCPVNTSSLRLYIVYFHTTAICETEVMVLVLYMYIHPSKLDGFSYWQRLLAA